jgi:hypothetical protein
MAENSAKLWFQQKANQLAINRITQAIENQGYALPCHVVKVAGAVVTVAFDVQNSPQSLPNITIPKAESPWIRMPTQVGDKGVTMPADVYLGGVSGIGGGTATMTRRGNLSTLVFVPVSNVGSPPIDQNAAQVQGPNGAIIRTTTGTTSEIVTNTSGTTVTFGNNTVIVNELETALNFGSTSLVLDSAGITMTFGASTIVFNGAGLSINGALYEDHTHPYFPGGGNETETGPPQG